MRPEDIDPTLCTHIHYAFHVMDDKNNVIIDRKGSPQPDIYNQLLALKAKNKDLQVVVSVGGWGEPDIKFSRVVNNPELRKSFIANTIAYIQKYKFDGLDIDWEYPVCWTGNCTAGPKSDRENFGIFVKEIRSAFDKLSPRLSISAAVVAGNSIADKAYDYKAIGEALDCISIMTYSLAPDDGGQTAHHTPYALSLADVEDYVDKGVPRDKCLLGVSFKAHTYELVDSRKHSIGAPIKGPGKDYFTYSQMCQLIKNKGWTKELGDGPHDPIAYKGTDWACFDDPYAIYNKSKWTSDNQYGGIIIWEIGADDYRKQCCSVANPMLRAISYGLYGTGSGPETYGCEHK